MRISDGLQVCGRGAEGDQLTDPLVALARLPRGAAPEQASLIRALAGDLDLDFDPLDCDLGAKWTGKRPAILSSPDPWRTIGDTVERLEALARKSAAATAQVEPSPACGRGQGEGAAPPTSAAVEPVAASPHPNPLPQVGEGEVK